VTDAIGHQGVSMAGQFAEVVRDRSVRADNRLEHAVRGLMRRNGNSHREAGAEDEP
jgi:hypothetical protein